MHIKDNGPGERGQWYRFSEGKGGDNIGFLREYMGMSFVDAVEALTGEHIDRTYTPSRTYEPKPVQQKARELSLAEADNARRVFAYLCKTRGLDYDMVSALVRGGSIAQEEKTGNVLFKYYDTDGKVIGAEKVGTSTEHKFKGIATGSAAGHGFEVVRGSGEKALFFESAIDMLSYLQMHDKELTDCRLVSMMGVKPNIVLDTMLRHNISPENVFLCSDNDTAGNEFAQRLQEQYPDMKRIVTPDTYKDWNDMLRGIPKQIEVEQETKTKEVDSVADLVTYGNRMWNDATDNRDKSLISMQLADFQRVQETLERSGINYYAYEMNGTVRMAVNDKDTDWLRNILGNVNITKSNRPYSPPEKNIIGNAEYRYIPQKEYVTADRDLVLKMADIMARRGMQFSGRIYPTGKGTLTVSRADLYTVRNIRDEVTAMRRQFASPEKGEPVGNRDYRANRDTHYYMSKLTIEQFKEIEPFLETSVSYHAVSRDGKVAFALDKENAPAFHRALESAQREVGMVKNMSDLGLPMEQMIALSPVIHRLAVEDMQLNLADLFDKRYDEAQFGEMLSLVNAYLSQAPAERYGEHSKLNDMLEAKSSFDRAIELSDFFSQHDFSDGQRVAISAMFVGDVTRGQLESIDETFTAEDIQAYDEILHNALQESDVADFLTAHKQSVLASHDNIDRDNAERVPKEEEVLFPQADLARFLAEHTLSSDEWEDMAYPLFERGYLDKHKPSENASFGYHLPETELYALAERYHQGDDIRREFALGLLVNKSDDNIVDKDKIEFVFEDGKISDRTFYYAENLRHTMNLAYGDDGITCSFGGMERFVSFDEIGQAFLDRTFEEFNDLAFWWVRDDMLDAIPDISDEKIADLISAFDGAALHGWEDGDNQPKLNRIKKALFDILGDEEQTEKAFAVIAKNKYNVSFEAEKPEIAPDSLSFRFGKEGDEWVSESELVDAFVQAHPDCSFALGNAIFEYLDDKQHQERMIPDLNAGYYKKTDFSITAVINGEEFFYDGRFDIGDGKGMGGGSLIDHIRTYNEGILGYTQYPFNQPEYKERAQRMLDIFIPFLEAHSELTAEEQRILDDFKEQHPIRTIDDVEKAQGRFQIYQLPSGDKYHGIRFEGMDELKAEGVQLNHGDYELVYEGIVGEFRGNATLEALYTQFNTNHPEDFRGHSLSVSDVVVIDIDGEQTAYYCDTAGFVEMPEFFREKELVQEKSETAKVSDLAVGDIIMYDGARREIEEISPDRIKMKDLDAPDYGGILLGTSDVLAYNGWQQDMESKGFEILSKAEKPAVEAPEQAEPEDKGPVSLRKVGDFYEMYGKNAEIGAEVLGLRMLSKNGSPMVGFPARVKDEYSAKLREAGYTVLIEQAFELNPPKRDPEKLQTLQQVVDKFFGTDCESAETEGGTWKLAIADGDKVGELFYGGEPVCGIYNRGDKMEIEPYRELTTFPALLRTAMLEHNPDKPVEIMDFQRTFETPLDKAKWLINDFCEAEYREGADFNDLHNVGLAFTTLTDDELPIQVTADLVDFKITYEFDGEVFKIEEYSDIEDMIKNGLTGLDFSDLVSVPDEVIDRHTGKDEQTVDLMSDAADISDTSSPAEDVPAVTLKYKGDAESLDEIKDKALSLGAAVIVDNAEGVISIDTYENHVAELDGLAYELGIMRVDDAPAVETPDIDKPLFTDAAVIDEIQRNENDDVPFWEKPDIEGEQLSLFGDSEPLTASKPALEAEQAEVQTPHIVEVGDRFRHKITGEVSEVVSLTGALPFYSDDCTITTDKGTYATTENISYDKLLNSGMYEYIGRAEPEKEQPAPLKPDPVAEVTPDRPAVAAETEKTAIPTVKNLSQLKKAIKPGMMFEITDHLRPECIGERRVVTGVNTVEFTSRKLDENGEPMGKDIHMEFDRAKNWSFDGGELTSHMENGSVVMSFHFIDSSEREQTVHAEKKPIPLYTGEWAVADNRELFREIVSENERFAKMANEVIGNGKNPIDSVKALVGEFGMERTAFLTALNIVAHPGDGRCYPVDKEWACKVLSPYLEVSPDEVIHRTPEKEQLFERMIDGGKLFSIHNTHLAEFAETLMPEYEKYLEKSRSAEKTSPELSVGDHLEYKGKEYKVESLDMDGFITLSNPEFSGAVKDRVTFIADEFINSGEYKVIEPKTEPTAETPDKSDNFTITNDNLGDGGAKTKFRANVDAIKTLKLLEMTGRSATTKEQETLSKYVGWGALAKAFDKDDPKWAAEYKELAELLTPEEYRQARASVNDAFYTSPTIIDGIYEALSNFGFEGGAVLEPAMGIGNFFGRMPEDMQAHSQLYGVEIDSLSGRIAQALYPDADIAIQGFEKNRFQNGCFDVAVGNVPFGELGFREENHIKVHPNIIYSIFCGSRMFLFSVSPLSRNL